MEDADFMLGLKNDPDTRIFAIKTQEEIKREDHIKWLSSHFMWMSVIETDYGARVGAMRIFSNEVSIWIDKPYRGLGLATEVLRRETEKGMYARIVHGNVASIRSFVKAGFVPVGGEINYYILRK